MREEHLLKFFFLSVCNLTRPIFVLAETAVWAGVFRKQSTVTYISLSLFRADSLEPISQGQNLASILKIRINYFILVPPKPLELYLE